MGRRAKGLESAGEQKEYQMTDALDRKRRNLDQEIAEFKAEKEREYRVFERQLKGKSKENETQDAPPSQRKRDGTKQKDAVVGAGPRQNEEANDSHRLLSAEEAKQKDPGSETEDPNATFLLVNGVECLVCQVRPKEALKERQKEPHGVFTPSDLETTPAEIGHRSGEILQPRFINLESLNALRRNNGSILSSSAENVHPPMTSPPLKPSRPLSSSVPPEKPSHHRCDSSRSDNSIASLRSSLRDPKQPRSPKRVLFSIDDALVSPSTSPIAQRTKTATPTKQADSGATIGGFEKFGVVRNQIGTGPVFTTPQSNDAGFPSLSAPANGWTNSLPTFGHSMKSNFLKDVPSAGEAGDFEHLESDDLFSFDEEMGRADSKDTQGADPEDDFDEDVAIDEKKNKESATATSPHAGSLPIEIKWP